MLGRSLILVALGTGIFACSNGQPSAGGSQSNWLRCAKNGSCARGLSCACGLCTTSCKATTDCGKLDRAATCEASTVLIAACQSAPPETASVCLVSCDEDGDCDTGASSLECRAGVCLPRVATAELDVAVTITADNAYGFGFGSELSLRSYFGGVAAILAPEIFSCTDGPENYTVPAADAQAGDFLYIVAWADSATTQGVLGQFRRGTTMNYTGEGNWTVCATGVNYTPASGGPSISEINRHITLCNQGDTDPLTTSAGWVDTHGNGIGALAVGEDNTTGNHGSIGNEFPVACGIDGRAKWMWFNWSPATITWPEQSPFVWPGVINGNANPDKKFLIFRLSAG